MYTEHKLKTMPILLTNISQIPKDKKVIVFDLDGTLVESKTDLDMEMAGLLTELLKNKKVAVIGGQSFDGFKKHLLDRLPASVRLDNLYILPVNGGSFYEYKKSRWEQIYSDNLTEEEKQKIWQVFDGEGISRGLAEDRGSQVTFSALGQVAPLEEKMKWQQEHDSERATLATKLREKLPDMEVRTAGLTSIDITRQGINKKYGIEQLASRLGIQPSDILFVGDAFEPDGNDHPVLDSGAVCFKVNSPEDTKRLISSLSS